VYRPLARVIKLLGSLACHALTMAWTTLQKGCGRTVPANYIILCYHAVATRKRARFARQMSLLRRYAEPARVDVDPPLHPGKRYAAVTFDDIYESVVENALPELQTRNIPCALFAAGDFLGQSPPWSDMDGYEDTDKIVSAKQLAELPSDFVVIGSHTMTHRSLSSLPEEEARRELLESRNFLRQMIGRDVRLLAFPHGMFNHSVIDWSKDAGYERVFSILPTVTHSRSSEYLTGRVVVDPDDWNIEFRLKLLGAYRWLPLAFEAKRKWQAFFRRCLQVSAALLPHILRRRVLPDS